MKTMKCEDLFNEVKNWLETERIDFSADSENATLEGWMTAANGMVQVSLRCEESPVILQVVCGFPLRVPKEKIADTALFLHNLNASLRIGSFCLNPELRMIVFRLTVSVRPEADLRHQFCETFATALGTCDDYLSPLALLLSSTTAAQKLVAKFAQEADVETTTPRFPQSRRLELN